MNTYNEHKHHEEDVNLEEFVGSQYLSKDDLAPGEQTTVTIAGVSVATMRESNREKPVLRFKEFRKDRALFFADHLQAGTYAIRYITRARAAGRAIAPSARVEAMYAPSQRGLSGSTTLTCEMEP